MNSILWILGTLLGLAPALARADAPSSVCAQAEEAIGEGEEHVKAERAEAARIAFQRAQSLCPQPRALAQIGLSEAMLELWLDAEQHLAAALEARNDGYIEAHRRELAERLDDIRSHLATLSIAGGPAGAEIFLDGALIAHLPFGAPRKILPGVHRIEVRGADGKEPIIREIAPAAREPIVIDLGQPITPPPPPYLADPRHRIGLAGVITGAVLIGGGIAANVAYWNQVNYWNYDCVYKAINMTRGENCPGTLQSVQTVQGLAIAGYVAGGTLAIGSAALMLLPPRRGATKERSAVSCGAGPGELGVACAGVF